MSIIQYFSRHVAEVFESLLETVTLLCYIFAAEELKGMNFANASYCKSSFLSRLYDNMYSRLPRT